MFDWVKRKLSASTTLPVPEVARDEKPLLKISHAAAAEIAAGHGAPLNPWTASKPAPGVVPADAQMALDSATSQLAQLYQWAGAGALSEGLAFLGYPYLAELSQRPEYRRISEIIASEATRKWIQIKCTDEERLAEIEKAMARFDIQGRFREACEQDGFFGRSQIFVDLGHELNDPELSKPLPLERAKIAKGKVKNFKVIEPFWCFPGIYNSTNPLAADYYRPQFWYVMSAQVHADRLLTFVGREMPDILKPQYQFGGLSLSQMAKPYIDNWIRTRQSVSDLVHSFSTMVLATNMSTVLSGGGADNLIRRLDMFNRTRDNRGVMAVDKASEELSNVTTPLSGLHELQSQAQEQMASVSGIPLVVLLGVTPSGLNASSDGEIRTFYASIKAYQERVFRAPLQTILDVIQLDLGHEIDPEITFEFVDLWEMPETDKAAVRKINADIDAEYISAGVVSNEEVRERVSNDVESPFYGVDLTGPAPEQPDDADLLDLAGAQDEDLKAEHVRLVQVLRSPSHEDDLAEADTQAEELAGMDAPAIQAAGVMLCAHDGRLLWLRRSSMARDYADYWCFPGGLIEPGESPELAAARELREETGIDLLEPLGEPVDVRNGFALYRAYVPEPFEVELNGEHSEATWEYLDRLDGDIHPTSYAALMALREKD